MFLGGGSGVGVGGRGGGSGGGSGVGHGGRGGGVGGVVVVFPV